MGEYDAVCIRTFLENQTRLFPEPVAETPEEAEDFLELCMAVVCDNLKEVRAYFEDCGTDISGLKPEQLKELQEVFPLPDGRFLVVDA